MPDVGSPQWIEALASSVADLDPGNLHITVLHRVASGPAWLIGAANGTLRVEAAPADAPADVTFTWEQHDLDAVAAGATTPLAVFQSGRLRVGGDLRRLADATDLFDRFPGVPA